MKGGMKGGFLTMIMSVLGVVLYVSMFSSIMSALATLYAVTGVSSFIAFQTILGIAPTVLLLGGVLGAGLMYYQGYKSTAATDAGGLMRMVLGVLQIILFVTLFGTIATSFVSLYSSYGTNTTWIAFGTVITITPTILFLAGIFSGVMTGVAGYKSRKGKKSL